MGPVRGQARRGFLPSFADGFGGREAFKRPEPPAEGVGGGEVGEVLPKLAVIVVMAALDGTSVFGGVGVEEFARWRSPPNPDSSLIDLADKIMAAMQQKGAPLMRLFLSGAALLACVSASALAQTATSSSSSTNGSKLDPNKIICHEEIETGSHLNSNKECHTRAEWLEIQRQQRAEVERAQANRGH